VLLAVITHDARLPKGKPHNRTIGQMADH
jgi:hypothetical protein